MTYDIANPAGERTELLPLGRRTGYFSRHRHRTRQNRHIREGSDAVRAYDARFRSKALLAATPTARIWLDPAQAEKTLGSRPSTRAFVEYYAGLLAASGGNTFSTPSGRRE